MCNIPIPLEKDSQSERLNQRRPVAAWQSHRGRTLETGRRIHTRERCWMQKAHRLRIYTLSLSLSLSPSLAKARKHTRRGERRKRLSLSHSLPLLFSYLRARNNGLKKQKTKGRLFISVHCFSRARARILSPPACSMCESTCVYIYIRSSLVELVYRGCLGAINTKRYERALGRQPRVYMCVSEDATHGYAIDVCVCVICTRDRRGAKLTLFRGG